LDLKHVCSANLNDIPVLVLDGKGKWDKEREQDTGKQI
jgi:hypothetical protein